MLTLILLLAVTLAAKLGVISGLRLWLQQFVQGFLGSFLAAWLLFQSVLVLCFLLLSACGMLRTEVLWGILVAANMCLIYRYGPVAILRSLTKPVGEWLASQGFVPAILFLGLVGANLGFLALHSLYFYDTTDDAVNFLMPRVALWYQNHSVFVQMPSHLFEVFAWEWNSDFNVLFYLAATGRDQSCTFANVECWPVLVAAAAYLVRMLGGQRGEVWPAALTVATMPVLLYLCMTIKSEPAACIGLLAGLAWLLGALRKDGPLAFHVLAILGLSFAAGCKVSYLPFTGLLISLVLFRLIRLPACRWSPLLLTIAIAVLNNSRHLLNVVQYGRILDHVTNQPRGFSLAKLGGNLRGIGSHLFVRGLEPSNYFALAAGCGLVGITALVVGATHGPGLHDALRRWRHAMSDVHSLTLIGCMVFSLLFFASSVPWYEWSFRYYLPWILPLLLLPFIGLSEAEAGITRNNLALVTGMGLICALQMFAAFRPSELTPGTTLVGAFKNASRVTTTERKLGRNAALGELIDRNLRSSRADLSCTVLILSSGYSVHYPLFGTDAGNHVRFAGPGPELRQILTTREFDVVAVTEPGPATTSDIATITKLGFQPTDFVANMRFYRRPDHNSTQPETGFVPADVR